MSSVDPVALDAWASAVVADAPPLTPAQLDLLARTWARDPEPSVELQNTDELGPEKETHAA